ncbi:MAG: hypothetical protein ACJAZ2_000281 [Glaciecola sp.]|jgi:hypothetical protein
MKKIILVALGFISYSVNAQNIEFEDPAFKSALLAHSPVVDSDSDGEISVQEAEALTSMDVKNKEISSMAELPYFVNLTSLTCTQNNLSSLNVWSNVKLNFLLVSSNKIQAMDVRILLDLVSFDCANNELNSLLIGNHIHLNNLNCSVNKLGAINLAGCKVLRTFQGHENNFQILDFSASPIELLNVTCADNNLKYLDVRLNTRISSYNLHALNNPLVGICVNATQQSISDTWGYPEGTVLSTTCDFGKIQFEDANFKAALLSQSTTIDVNKDGEISESEAWFTTEISIRKSSVTSVKELSFFPNLTVLYVSENDLTSLEVSGNTKLQRLDFSRNGVSTIDVSGLPDLTDLLFEENNVSVLDIDSNPKLINLWVRNNNLADLSVLNNTALTTIVAQSNSLSTLDLSMNLALTNLYVDSNNIRNLDISNNPLGSYVSFTAKGNPMKMVCLNSGHLSVNSFWEIPASAAYSLTCDSTRLGNIDFPDTLFKNFLIDHCTLSKTIDNSSMPVVLDEDADREITYDEVFNVSTLHCGGHATLDSSLWFEDMTGIEYFENLTQLQIDNQLVKQIDVSKLTKLEMLIMNSLQLETVVVKDLPNLVVLSFIYNNVTSVELSGLPNLKVISATNNNLTTLDISEFTTLSDLQCEGNSISQICVPKSRYESISIAKDSVTVLDTLCGINSIIFSDVNLKNAILNYTPAIDTNGDSIVTYNEALAIDTIDLSFKNILLFAGLDAFKNLKSINISYNQLALLDVSQLKYLTQLVASNNALKSLITFTNSSEGGRRIGTENNTLLDLDVSSNSFTELDISIFSELNTFDGSGNTELLEICVTSNQLDNKVDSWSKDVTTTWSASNCARVTSVSQDEITKMTVYPNPASTVVWTSQKVMQIYSMLGNKKEIKWVSDSSIDISGFNSGVYTFQFLDGSTSKLVVNKR